MIGRISSSASQQCYLRFLKKISESQIKVFEKVDSNLEEFQEIGASLGQLVLSRK